MARNWLESVPGLYVIVTNAFLIIDAQVDFCQSDGALYVPGAEQDITRIAALIEDHAEQIDHIVVTLDTHHVLDIAHPLFWANAAGNHPDPFTSITAASVDAGEWVPLFSAEKARQYVQDLEADGQFTHFIWPEHCLLGSPGAALHPMLAKAVKTWSQRRERDYVAIQKGLYPLTEHFGIFRAQVPDPAVPETGLNTALIADLNRFEAVYLMGEAKSHCVANSLKQILDYAPELVPKMVVISDCTSDVTDLGYLGLPIYEEAARRGVRFTESERVFW